MAVPNESIKPTGETHTTARFWEIFGIVLLVVLALATALFFIGKWRAPKGGGIVVTPEMRKELFDQMSTRSPDAVPVTSSQKKKLIDQMSQLAQPASGTGTAPQIAAPGTSTSVPVPVVSSSDRNKLYDAMQQKL